jgi:hypothetical protein
VRDTHDDFAGIVDENRIGKTEAIDAVRDLADLLVRVGGALYGFAILAGNLASASLTYKTDPLGLR